jgi:hypothetical protein
MEHDQQLPTGSSRWLHGDRGMRDLAADWKKWSAAERLLAVALMLMLIRLPLRVWIVGAPL